MDLKWRAARCGGVIRGPMLMGEPEGSKVVNATPKRLAEDARCVFSDSDLPGTFSFFERLSPLHQRLFVVDLWQTLSRVAIENSEDAADDLLEMVEGWESTADLDADPDTATELASPTVYRPMNINQRL